MGTAQCTEPTLHKTLGKCAAPIGPENRRRSGASSGSGATVERTRPQSLDPFASVGTRSATEPSSAAGTPSNRGRRSSRQGGSGSGNEPGRDQVLARSAAAVCASRGALKELWARVASSFDAHLARRLSTGKSLEEPEIAEAGSAVSAKDSASLLQHLRQLSQRDNDTEAPAVVSEAEELCSAEERHVVLCQLEDSIRRADVDDMELWLDEAVHLGLSVALERQYCDGLRQALVKLMGEHQPSLEAQAEAAAAEAAAAEAAAAEAEMAAEARRVAEAAEAEAARVADMEWSPEGDEAGACDPAFSTWNTAEETYAGTGTSADPSPFATWTSAYSDAAGGGESPGDSCDSPEVECLWAELERALSVQDCSSALEAIAMLESIGELDAEMAAEVRAEARAEEDRAAAAEEGRAAAARMASAQREGAAASAAAAAAWQGQRATSPRAASPHGSASPIRRRTSAASQYQQPSRAPRRHSVPAADFRRAQQSTINVEIPVQAPSRPRSSSKEEAAAAAAAARFSQPGRDFFGRPRASATSWGGGAAPKARPSSPPRAGSPRSRPTTPPRSRQASPRGSAAPSPRAARGVRYAAPSDRHSSAPPSRPAAAAADDASGVSQGQAPMSRGRLFKEALWKRRVNMATIKRMGREQSQPTVGSAPIPKVDGDRQAAQRAYSSGVQSAVRGGGAPGAARGASGPGVAPRGGARPSQAAQGGRPTSPTRRSNTAPEEYQHSWQHPRPRASAVGGSAPQRMPFPQEEQNFGPRNSRGAERAGGRDFAREFGREQRHTAPPGSAPKSTAAPKRPPPPQPQQPPPQRPTPSAAPPPSSAGAAAGSSQPPPRPSPPPQQPRGPQSGFGHRSSSGATGASSGGASSGGASGAGSSASASRAGSGTEARYLELLGLRAGFSPEELRVAYKKAAMKWHPDRPAWRAAGEAEVRHATEMFQKVKDAYDYLSGKPSRPRQGE